MTKKNLIILITLLIILVGCESNTIIEDPIQECLRMGGEWKQFPNGCIDSCYSQENSGIFCTQALTEGCECGQNSCWDTNTCRPIDTSKIQKG